jgi:hypothetical protein
MLAPPACLLIMVLSARYFGAAGRWLLGPAPEWVGAAGAFLALVIPITVMSRWVPWALRHPELVSTAVGPPVAGRWLVLTTLGIVLLGWTEDAPVSVLGQVGLTLNVFSRYLLTRNSFQSRTVAALTQLHSARRSFKWAVIELERCRQLVASGSRAPLAAAEDELIRLQNVQAEALRTLHSLGYRASLRRVETSGNTVQTSSQ